MGLITTGIKDLSQRLYGYFVPTYDKKYFMEQLNTCKRYQLSYLRDKFKGKENEAIEWLCEVISNKDNSTKLRCKALECVAYFKFPQNENLNEGTQEKLANVLLDCLDDPNNDIKSYAINSCRTGADVNNPEFIKKVKRLSDSTDPKISYQITRLLSCFEDPEAIQILKSKLTTSTLKLELGDYSWDDAHAHSFLCEAVESAYTFGMGNHIYYELEKIVKAPSLEKETLRQSLVEKYNEYVKIYGRKDVNHVLANYLLFNGNEQLKKEALHCLCTVADKESIIEALLSTFKYKYNPSYSEAHAKKYLSLHAKFALESKEKGISVQQLIQEKYLPNE